MTFSNDMYKTPPFHFPMVFLFRPYRFKILLQHILDYAILIQVYNQIYNLYM